MISPRARALLILALLPAACSDEPPSHRGVRPLIEHGAARYAPSPREVPARVLFDAATAGGGAWFPVLRLGEEAAANELEALRGSTEFGEDGSLTLRAAHGGWLAFAAVEPGQSLVLELELTASRISDRPRSGASFGLAEFSRLPADARDARGLYLGATLGSPLPGERADQGCTRLLRVGPETRAVGIALSVHDPREGASPEVRFAGVRLSIPGSRHLLSELVGHRGPLERPEEPPIGRFSLGLTERPGVALLPGARLELDLALPAEAARLELFGGLLPMTSGLGSAAVELIAELELDGRRLELVREELHLGSAPEARWRDLSTALPPELAAGGDCTLVLRTAGEAPGYAPIFASARLISARPERDGLNVVVISIDTLRRDRMGCYGHGRNTTPSIDRFAETALVFDDVWANGPYTLPTHMSLFSGQHASVHGVHGPTDVLDPRRTRLLAELFAERGYATAAYTGGAYVLPSFGFGRGFDSYGAVDPALDPDSTRWREAVELVPEMGDDLARDNSVEAIGAWLEEHRDEPFLLFFHTYAAHEFAPARRHLEALGLEPRLLEEDPLSRTLLGPFDGWPDEVPPGAFERLFGLYDAAVLQADEAVGALLAQLERLGLDEQTLVILTSDHGKEIGDHGLVGHGHTLYGEMLRVPLLVRAPGLAPGRDPTPAMTVDILPTILAALDLAPPEGIQGVDLLQPVAPRPLYAEVDQLAARRALRAQGFKTIHNRRDREVVFDADLEWERYDLVHDPGETAPLGEARADAEALEGLHRVLLRRAEALASDLPRSRELNEGERAFLEALGYTQGTGD